MMFEFLFNNKIELAQRCRDKVAQRPGRSATSVQLQNGVPLFLDQLIRTLQIEQTQNPLDSHAISGPAGGVARLSQVSVSAALHGKALLEMGFSVDEVVHDYGDLCQAITDLAVERDAPFEIDEFRTLNRCLDNAIADAVNEFSYQKELATADRLAAETNERARFLAHDLRNALGTASLAFTAAKAGQLSLSGATGSILERSITNLAKIIDESVVDFRANGAQKDILSSFSLSDFVAALVAAARLATQFKGCTLMVSPVDPLLAIGGNRELLLSAVASLLQNSIRFTERGTEVRLNAYAAGDKIKIDIADHCRGLPPDVEAWMFQPYTEDKSDRNGLALSLNLAQQSVTACGGSIRVRDLPLVGCIVTVTLPRLAMPT